MIKTARFHFAAALLALTVLSAPQALADPNGMVLVTVDGQLMRNVPEAGSVRVVFDTQGRRLVINRWNEVIGFEVPAWQYRQQHGNPRPGYGNQIESAFPVAPPPPEDDFYRNDYRRGGIAAAPPAPRIERRDLNPTTGTVPDPADAPNVIQAPRFVEPAIPRAEQPATGPKLTKAQVAALQVYLDRNGISPGVIDGRMGSNVNKALDAYFEKTGERINPADTDLIMSRLASSGGLAFTTYTITAEDAAGPFIASVPVDYAEKARLERLAYTSTLEMLAERFHMDEAYLQSLNPDVDFTRPGVQIKIANPAQKITGKVTRIIADKGRKQVRGYDANGKLLVAYPATIGSTSTPSPSGEVTIERVARNPGYTYNPKINFKQGDNDKILQVPPGPNGPVGTIWIALSKPTYGIHGTPEPSKIGKTESNGCVRLTNWDAEELAGLVTPGVTVSFVE
ncbi:MAG: L,D-transpeptidase [Hoeflea sp.]|uniref:L,D-transpeptidase n=1 Tax=Hoeflea sp. TaxID=1940281 RepID=UPI0027313A7D|nr:L,D-transpeptidase [Hoeflea sp.]MDP2119219.1 L,D-transpeptidase [Hoeflea sp.]